LQALPLSCRHALSPLPLPLFHYSMPLGGLKAFA
jgi:hypothetical protein